MVSSEVFKEEKDEEIVNSLPSRQSTWNTKSRALLEDTAASGSLPPLAHAVQSQRSGVSITQHF